MNTALSLPKNVIILSDFSNINGGQAKVAIDTARLLADSGINVVFFAACGTPDQALHHPRINIVLLNQFDVLSDKNRARAMRQGIWNTEARQRLKHLCSTLSADDTVIHCHGYAKALSPSIGPSLTSDDIATVYTMHEYFLACPNGGFYDYQKGEICDRRALGVSCLTTNCDVRRPLHKAWRVARQLATWGPGRMPRHLSDIIYISRTQLRAMAPYISASTTLHHLPNPVQIPDLPPVSTHENEIYLFIGRLNPEKGGQLFARAAKLAGVRAVFVGDGIEAEEIRSANPNAEIIGWQSPAEVQRWIGRARALVFPSLWYECQPLVPLEAIGRGVPVIAGRWTAAAESIESGKTGLIFDEPSPECLAEALTEAGTLPMFDPEPYRQASSPALYLDRLSAIYHQMLRRRHES